MAEEEYVDFETHTLIYDGKAYDLDPASPDQVLGKNIPEGFKRVQLARGGFFTYKYNDYIPVSYVTNVKRFPVSKG